MTQDISSFYRLPNADLCHLYVPQASLRSLNYDFALITLAREAPRGTSALAIKAGVGDDQAGVVLCSLF